MPMAMMALVALGPNTAVISMAISSAGKAKTRSLARMMISSSSVPRCAAAQSPSGVPMPTPTPTAISATAIEVRAPTRIMREHVAAVLVGAEPVRGAKPLQLVRDVLRGVVVGRPDEARQRDASTKIAVMTAPATKLGERSAARSSVPRGRSAAAMAASVISAASAADRPTR